MKHTANIYLGSYSNLKYFFGFICYTFKSDVNISNFRVPKVITHLEDDVDLHLGIENIFNTINLESENNQKVCLIFDELPL